MCVCLQPREKQPVGGECELKKSLAGRQPLLLFVVDNPSAVLADEEYLQTAGKGGAWLLGKAH